MMRREPYGQAYACFAWEEVRAALGWSDHGKVCLATSIADRHVARERPALICISRDGTDRCVSYRELAEASSRLANVLRRYGVEPGDRVAGLMPRVPEALIARVWATTLFDTGSITVARAFLLPMMKSVGRYRPDEISRLCAS
jgi:acetyl-CoA synthetase